MHPGDFTKQEGPGPEGVKLEGVKQEAGAEAAAAARQGAAAASSLTAPADPAAPPGRAVGWEKPALAAAGGATPQEVQAGRNIGVVWWELQVPDPGRQESLLCCREHGTAIADRHGLRLRQAVSLEALASVVQDLKATGELQQLACCSRVGIPTAASPGLNRRPSPHLGGLRLWEAKGGMGLLRPAVPGSAAAAAGMIQSQPLLLLKTESLSLPPLLWKKEQTTHGAQRAVKLEPLLLPAGGPQAFATPGSMPGAAGGRGVVAGMQSTQLLHTGQATARGRSRSRPRRQEQQQLRFAAEITLPSDASGHIVATAAAKSWHLLYCGSQQQRAVAEQLGQLWRGLRLAPTTDAMRSVHATLLARHGEERAVMRRLRRATTLHQLRDELRELREDGSLSQLAGRAAARDTAAREERQKQRQHAAAQHLQGQEQQQQQQQVAQAQVQERRRGWPLKQREQVVGGAAGQGPAVEEVQQVVSWGEHCRARRKQTLPEPVRTWRLAGAVGVDPPELSTGEGQQGLQPPDSALHPYGRGAKQGHPKRGAAAAEAGGPSGKGPKKGMGGIGGKQRPGSGAQQFAANQALQPPPPEMPAGAADQGGAAAGSASTGSQAASIGRLLLLLRGGASMSALAVNVALAAIQYQQLLQVHQGGPAAAGATARLGPLLSAAFAAQHKPRHQEQAEQALHDSSTATAAMPAAAHDLAPVPSPGPHGASQQPSQQAAAATASQQHPRPLPEGNAAHAAAQASPAVPSAGTCNAPPPLLAPRLLACCQDARAAAAGLTPALSGSFMACFTGSLTAEQRREAAEWVSPLLDTGQFEAAGAFMAGIVQSCGVVARQGPVGSSRELGGSQAGEDAAVVGAEQNQQLREQNVEQEDDATGFPSPGEGLQRDGGGKGGPGQLGQPGEQEQGGSRATAAGGARWQARSGALWRKKRASREQRSLGLPSFGEGPENSEDGEVSPPRKRVARERQVSKPWWIV